MMRDMTNNLDAVGSLAPANYTASANGAGVDRRDFDGSMVVFHAGTADFGNADEVYTPVVEESDDDVTYTAVAAADLDGTLSNLAGNSVQRVGYKGAKRYLRARLTIAGTSPAIQASALVLRGIPHHAPVA